MIYNWIIIHLYPLSSSAPSLSPYQHALSLSIPQFAHPFHPCPDAGPAPSSCVLPGTLVPSLHIHSRSAVQLRSIQHNLVASSTAQPRFAHRYPVTFCLALSFTLDPVRYALPGTTGPSLHCRSFIAIQSRPCAAVLSTLSTLHHFSFIFPFIRLPLYGMKKAPSRFDLTLCFLFAILVVRLDCVGWTKCRKWVG